MSRLEFSISTREEFDGLRNVGRTGFASLWRVPPLEAYLSLKSLFGEADEVFDEEKTQWTFYLKTDDAQIEVYDYKLETWSIGVYEKNKNESRAQQLIDELEKQIVHASRRHRDLVSALRKHPAGHIIENPFALYYGTADELLRLAEQLSGDCEKAATVTMAIGYWSTPYSLCRAAFFQFIAAIEGLLNLISELYLKQDLRDVRIADRLAREQIDVKLRLIPIYCDCFPGRPLDHTTDAIRNFNLLVAARNDFIHANVTKSMKKPIIYHENLTFLLPVEKSQNPNVPGSISHLGISELRRIRAVVDDLVKYLIASMNPRDRKVFGSVLRDDFINVKYEDGIPVIQR